MRLLSVSLSFTSQQPFTILRFICRIFGLNYSARDFTIVDFSLVHLACFFVFTSMATIFTTLDSLAFCSSSNLVSDLLLDWMYAKQDRLAVIRAGVAQLLQAYRNPLARPF